MAGFCSGVDSHFIGDRVVTVAGQAVGERSGAAQLYRFGHRRTRGALLPVGAPETVPVDMVSLDDYCRTHALEERPVGFIKLGIEGYEYFALRGAERTLPRCRALLVEFAPQRLLQAGVEPAALLDLLVESGFAPAVVDSGAAEEVSREALLADDRRRHLFWYRPAVTAEQDQPDPDALAI